jgi:hypothetical protein
VGYSHYYENVDDQKFVEKTEQLVFTSFVNECFRDLITS